MHITPDPPSMSIARVRELASEMAAATTPVVCSFTRDQLIDLLAEIDLRRPGAAPAPAPPPPVTIREVSPVTQYAEHRNTCNRCRSGDRCDAGTQLYTAACVSLMDQVRLVL
jgi:hypothetical protein